MNTTLDRESQLVLHKALAVVSRTVDAPPPPRIIGSTDSGKPVYCASHAWYSGGESDVSLTKDLMRHTRQWTAKDHRDAANIHQEVRNSTRDVCTRTEALHAAVAHRRAAEQVQRARRTVA